ncbi:MAG: hypothetical protein HY936_05520 [Nitrosomonadales bacterium]|nr:hypothetical protein [Nitrosomonadales bacterium]
MKKALANNVVDEAKPAKVRAHLAKIIAAQSSHSKSARQAAFSKVVSHLSVAKAVSRARLIPEVNPAEFRIVRMPG